MNAEELLKKYGKKSSDMDLKVEKQVKKQEEIIRKSLEKISSNKTPGTGVKKEEVIENVAKNIVKDDNNLEKKVRESLTKMKKEARESLTKVEKKEKISSLTKYIKMENDQKIKTDYEYIEQILTLENVFVFAILKAIRLNIYLMAHIFFLHDMEIPKDFKNRIIEIASNVANLNPTEKKDGNKHENLTTRDKKIIFNDIIKNLRSGNIKYFNGIFGGFLNIQGKKIKDIHELMLYVAENIEESSENTKYLNMLTGPDTELLKRHTVDGKEWPSIAEWIIYNLYSEFFIKWLDLIDEVVTDRSPNNKKYIATLKHIIKHALYPPIRKEVSFIQNYSKEDYSEKGYELYNQIKENLLIILKNEVAKNQWVVIDEPLSYEDSLELIWLELGYNYKTVVDVINRQYKTITSDQLRELLIWFEQIMVRISEDIYNINTTVNKNSRIQTFGRRKFHNRPKRRRSKRKSRRKGRKGRKSRRKGRKSRRKGRTRVSKKPASANRRFAGKSRRKGLRSIKRY